MGWTSEKLSDVSESSIKAAADALVTSGLHRVGYAHVLIADGWQGTRNEDGFILPDARRFPSGMKALVDYVKQKGLKVGLTSGAGDRTCGGGWGSRGHEYQDALQYARWGIDYLEYDWCHADGLSANGAYVTLRDALRSTRRPIVLSVADGGTTQAWNWAKGVAQLWDTASDVSACFTCVEERGVGKSWGVLPLVDRQEGYRAFAGPGHWNDLGALQVGAGMTDAEDRAHVSLWAMLAAPLIANNDLTSMSESTRKILTNPEVIAVDQDNLGIQGFRYRTDGALDVWVRPLTRGQLAVLFLNRGATALDLAFDWSKHEVVDDLTRKRYSFSSATYSVRDLWAHQPRDTTKTPLSTTLQSHDVLLLRLTPNK
jgi:alpha-galactosidase